MSWDFAIHGHVIFADDAELDAWLMLPIEQPVGVDGPLSAPVDLTQSVHAALIAFRSDELHIDRKGRKIKLRGWVEKTGMLDLGPPLVGALFAAAKIGATGRLWLIAVGNTLAYKVTLADGAGTIRKRDEDMENSDMVTEVQAAMERPLANTWLLPPVDESPDDYWFTVGREESGKRLAEVLAALRVGGKRKKLTKGDVQKMLCCPSRSLNASDPRSFTRTRLRSARGSRIGATLKQSGRWRSAGRVAWADQNGMSSAASFAALATRSSSAL